MNGFGQKIMSRILRSKVLPLLTILALFTGLVAITGNILWRVEIKEEYPLVGALSLQPSTEGGDEELIGGKAEPVKLTVLGGEAPSPLQPGQKVKVGLELRGGRTEYIEAQFVRYGQAGSMKSLLLDLKDKGSERYQRWLGLVDESKPQRINLTMRRRKLLSVALEKGGGALGRP